VLSRWGAGEREGGLCGQGKLRKTKTGETTASKKGRQTTEERKIKREKSRPPHSSTAKKGGKRPQGSLRGCRTKREGDGKVEAPNTRTLLRKRGGGVEKNRRGAERRRRTKVKMEARGKKCMPAQRRKA